MNTFLVSFLSVFLVLVAAVGFVAWTSRPRGKTHALANDGALTVGVHAGARITGYHESAPVSTRFLLATKGTGDNNFRTPTSVLDIPIAVCTDEPLATTDIVNFQGLCGADQTVKMVAAGAIPDGVPVVTNGDGKIRVLPSVAGMYWCVGYSATTATADGELVEVYPALFTLGVDVIT
jgi:hypothetical protein